MIIYHRICKSSIGAYTYRYKYIMEARNDILSFICNHLLCILYVYNEKLVFYTIKSIVRYFFTLFTCTYLHPRKVYYFFEGGSVRFYAYVLDLLPSLIFLYVFFFVFYVLFFFFVSYRKTIKMLQQKNGNKIFVHWSTMYFYHFTTNFIVKLVIGKTVITFVIQFFTENKISFFPCFPFRTSEHAITSQFPILFLT